MKKITNLLFFTFIFTQLGFIIGSDIIVSLFNNASILFIICLFFLNLNKMKKKEFFYFIVISFILLSNYFIKTLINIETFPRDLFYLFILIVSLMSVRNTELDIKQLKLWKISIYALSLAFWIGSFNPSNYGFYPYNFLMFGYSNPNVIASILLTNIVFTCVLASRKLFFLTVDIIIIFLNLYILSLTGSRTGLLSSVFIILLTAFRKKLPSIFSKFFGYLSVVFPIIFIPLKNMSAKLISYMSFFYESNKVKNLNGRDFIWTEQIRILTSDIKYFLLGAQLPNYPSVYRNSHNYLLFILFNNGFVVFFIYIIFLFKNIYRKLSFKSNIYNTVSLLGWFIIVISNTFESHLSSGIISVSILWTLLLSDFKININ